MTEINLGDQVRDRISGLIGIVVGRTTWLYGCVRCSVQPQELKDGKPAETVYIDEPQLELVKRAVITDDRDVSESKRAAAGPRADPTSRPEAQRRP